MMKNKHPMQYQPVYQQNYRRQSQLESPVSSLNLEDNSSLWTENISLRGHRDSSTELEKDYLFPENRGNFWTILEFRIDAGDNVLSEHLATAKRNATYTSSTIQNQHIQIIGNQIRDNVLELTMAT